MNARLPGKAVCLAGGIVLDDDIADLFGVPRRWFGEASKAGEIVGCVSTQGAVETGLAEGIPVVMEAGDSQWVFLGAGLARQGVALNAAGTTDVVAVALDSPPPS